jgi:hypothetical protein
VRRLAVAAVLVAVAVGATRGAPQQDAPDAAALAILAKIRDEGLHRSQVEPVFDMFVNVIGPSATPRRGRHRPTASRS